MSNSYNYLPQPPRVWSRVQGRCTYIENENSDVYTQMIIKGNILQYKANSAQYTKKMKYSQLARGYGPMRKKSYATQTQSYSNPNMTGLLRVNYETYPYPNNIIGAPNNVAGPFSYVPNPFDCSDNAVQDGGSLVCGVYANPCTGEIVENVANTNIICNPSSASDVPGNSILCWNGRIQTWYPKQRYFMNNSTSKWPINYKGFVSAVKPIPPVLYATTDNCLITLSWTPSNKNCLPLTGYNIYVNNQLYTKINDPSITTYSFTESIGSYVIYITALSNNIQSDPSNKLQVLIENVATVISYSNSVITKYSYNGYSGIIMQPTVYPSFDNTVTKGILQFSACTDLNLNTLIVGSGGGGAAGSYNTVNSYYTNGGCGGGGGGVNYISNIFIPKNTVINLEVGVGGGGRTPGNNASNTGYNGRPGSSSSISFGSTSIISYGGGGGQGTNTTSANPGGTGGNALSTYPVSYGGSAGGGGAVYSCDGAIQNVTKGGLGGTGITANGANGSNGQCDPNGLGGSGGTNVTYSFFIPFLNNYVLVGGGGGGGNINSGGKAGNGIGGSGTNSTIAGESASNYGGGGGGGGAVNSSNINNGGNGANGVIMIWWNT